MRKTIVNILGKTIAGLEAFGTHRQQRAQKITNPGMIRTQTHRRSYKGAETGRMFSGWTTTPIDINEELKRSLLPCRARGRDLVKNNVYARKFLHMVGTNIVGAKGVAFQSKVKNASGKPDQAANKKIEEAFKDWGKAKNCSVTRKLSWRAIQHIFIKTIARDGECLIRKVKSTRFKYGFALQIIDPNHLDESYNEELPNGDSIKLGIQFNKWGEPTFYHIRKKITGHLSYSVFDREAIPADEIIHGFRPEYAEQVRDVSWMSVGMTDVKMLDGYKESAVIAARVGASKMGFLITPTGQEYRGDDEETEGGGVSTEEGTATKTGNVITDVEPGHIEELPFGYKFETFDPKNPTGDLDPFMTKEVQGIASGWNVNYIRLANDQKGVSYSTDRSSTDEERDNWMVLQDWLVEILCEDIFDDWLLMALTTQALPLPISRIEKFNSPKFQPRRWRYIDPAKDEKANTSGLKNETTSRRRIAEGRGEDIEEILEELAWEEEEIAKRRRKIRGTDKPQKDDGDNDA